MTAGSACSGIHHKALHGSGVAFCHKVVIKANPSAASVNSASVLDDDLDQPPSMNQPVLLEIQAVSVNGLPAKVMFDNGSTAVLITLSFAAKLGLVGEMVTYWLVVVGHEKILWNTMLYTFRLVDNSGRSHEVRAYGIDAISEDSAMLDLSGVKAIFPGAPREVFDRPD